MTVCSTLPQAFALHTFINTKHNAGQIASVIIMFLVLTKNQTQPTGFRGRLSTYCTI